MSEVDWNEARWMSAEQLAVLRRAHAECAKDYCTDCDLLARWAQAEALVGRLREALQDAHDWIVGETDQHPADCRDCVLLADPTGARLAEEQRALEACYRRLKNDVRIGRHMHDCGCGTCANVAAVERARQQDKGD